MLKKYKKTLIVSSLVTLLPIAVGLLLWNRFPEHAIIHWGWNGQPDGWATIPTLILTPPLLLLLTQWLCIWITQKDPGNKGRNQKPLTLVLWIIPLLSNVTSGILYALALGLEFSPVTWMIVPMGLMFAAIGNYLPKTKMNSTMGIKVIWAYTSEANWNATHRFAGKLWVAGGFLVAASAFLPGEAAIIAMIVILAAISIVPILYSRKFYQKEYADGKVEKASYSKVDRRILKISMVFLAVLTVFVCAILFTGELDYQFEEDYLTIDASYYGDLMIRYSDIETVEYREGNIPGIRVGGFGSFRLLMGYVQNDEFGVHIRYTYYKPEACIVVAWRDNTLVLSGETAEETQAIYQELCSKIH